MRLHLWHGEAQASELAFVVFKPRLKIHSVNPLRREQDIAVVADRRLNRIRRQGVRDEHLEMMARPLSNHDDAQVELQAPNPPDELGRVDAALLDQPGPAPPPLLTANPTTNARGPRPD